MYGFVASAYESERDSALLLKWKKSYGHLKKVVVLL